MSSLVKLGSPQDAAADEAILEGWRVVEGEPKMKTVVLHTSNDKSVISGYWEATPGTYHATYTDYEFVHVIAGKMTITPDGEPSVSFGPGDAFVVEPGFSGLWKVEETIRKHFAFKIDVSGT